jgi:hypothetical protein
MVGSKSEQDLQEDDKTIFSFVNTRDGQSFPLALDAPS